VNTRYSRGNDLDDDEEYGERDREISLGTTFILGIFFALVLICAIFFAFGYSMGRRSLVPASSAAAPTAETNVSKPASGVPAAQASTASSNSADTSSQTGTDDQAADSGGSTDDSGPALVPVSATPKPASTVVLPTKPSPRTVTAARTAPATVAAAPGVHLPVVQVAAISRQGDANMLLSALKRKGYNASVHQVPQDKLFHIQLGPFATKKDAEAMRQKLIGDGYNAIVK
jgi:cell division septation protein DedD